MHNMIAKIAWDTHGVVQDCGTRQVVSAMGYSARGSGGPGFKSPLLLCVKLILQRRNCK